MEVVSETGKVHSADISSPTGYVAKPNVPKSKDVAPMNTPKFGCKVNWNRIRVWRAAIPLMFNQTIFSFFFRRHLKTYFTTSFKLRLNEEKIWVINFFKKFLNNFYKIFFSLIILLAQIHLRICTSYCLFWIITSIDLNRMNFSLIFYK